MNKGTPTLRPPLPRWKRAVLPHRFALDHLDTLVRYRRFEPTKDLDPSQRGYLADLLATGRLYVPVADSFNDPWEAAPAFQPVWWRPDVHRQIADFLAHLAPQNNTPENYAKLLQDTRALGAKAILDRTQDVMLGHLRQTPILSLSDRADNFLMWSYYGNGHNGYAVVFNARVMPFASAVQVRYSRRHPRILLTRRDMAGIAATVLGTKARDWRHEREWRVIISAANASRIGYTSFQPAKPTGYYGVVASESILGIVVGHQLFNGPDGRNVMDLLRRYAAVRKSWVAEVDRRAFRVVLRAVRFT